MSPDSKPSLNPLHEVDGGVELGVAVISGVLVGVVVAGANVAVDAGMDIVETGVLVERTAVFVGVLVAVLVGVFVGRIGVSVGVCVGGAGVRVGGRTAYDG